MDKTKAQGSTRTKARIFVAIAAILGAWSAAAQRAPIDGAHYAWNSGAGFKGSVNATGEFTAEVPLDLPPARGGMPVPVKVIHGGKQVGAAGLGWDVPLSFVSRHNTTAKRRPAPSPFSTTPSASLDAPERMSLTFNGSPLDLVRNAGNTAWVARRGNEQIEVRENGDGVMVAYDGEGRTYNFSARGATAGSRLMDGNLYLLTSIVDTNSNSTVLGYSIASPALPGGGTGLAINLASVSYNQHPGTPGCFKNKVHLTYDAPAGQPLSMSVRDGNVLARMQKLSAITVKSKATCSSGEVTLSSYAFAYQPDPDTRLPQLQSVKRTGQAGTAEQGATLPVATYTYGSIVDKATNQITYRKVQNAGPPSAPGRYEHGIMHKIGFLSQTLLDFNGDGRSDFFSTDGTAYLSASGSAGPILFGTPHTYASKQHDVLSNNSESYRTHDTRAMFIDMNADGRIDYLSSGPIGFASWTLQLNTPDPEDPSKTIWVERRLGAQNPASVALPALPPHYYNGMFLGSSDSVSDQPYAACWMAKPFSGGLRWENAPPTSCPNFQLRVRERLKTITAYELKDVNGDGYPDFVYNAGKVIGSDAVIPREPPFAPSHMWQTQITEIHADITGSRDIMALINTAGVHAEEAIEFLSSPVVLVNGAVDGCGVARWRPAPADPTGGRLELICGFQDINGDGIVDRVTTSDSGQTTARLGTGDMSRPYSTASISLPGPLLRVETQLTLAPRPSNPNQYAPDAYASSACLQSQGNSAIDFSLTTAMLRDINGDGIPDYLRAPLTANSWQVSMGTGAGFAPEVTIVATDGLAMFGSLAVEKRKCPPAYFDNHPTAGTVAGLFEMDGDGQPEFVSMNPTSQKWDIWQLKPPVAQDDVGGAIASVPAAGRLTKIDYGYGASTRIGYRSAKEEWNAAHHVPFPEIVVESIATKDANNSALMATTRYAYRGARMIFDPVHDAFRFPGYQRTVKLDSYVEPGVPAGTGTATITDSHGLPAFDASMSAETRFRRYLLAGQTRSVVTLAGIVGTNPWDTLNVDVERDQRRSSGVHYEWDVRQLGAATAPAGDERCLDMVYPYDYAASKAAQLSPNADACVEHGFIHASNVFAWRGTPGSADAVSSSQTVQTNTEVTSIDDFGRETGVRYDNDLARSDDDLCIQTEFAEPAGSQKRVLNAPAMITTTDCSASAKVLARTVYEYDTPVDGEPLPFGTVSAGRLTARLVSQIDVETGMSLGPDIREFEAMYDVAGNPAVVSTLREDGALLEISSLYDAFRIAETMRGIGGVNADGSSLPTLSVATEIDPLTMAPLGVTDQNGTRRGRTYDGFQRAKRETIRPPAGAEGVLAAISFLGFEVGQTGGRRIERKEFVNPVPASSVGTAPGQTTTTFLDPLGRTSHAEVALGADYGNKKMTVGKRTFDSLGRVVFEADPVEGSPVNAYGTTYHYHADGMPQCVYRAHGKRAFSAAGNPQTQTSEELEQLVSCSTHRFESNQLIVARTDAASRLPGSPQAGTVNETVHSAISRLLTNQTVRNGGVLEKMSYAYDPLGQLTLLTRHGVANDEDLTKRWRYDSLGRAFEFEDAGGATQQREYDNWGGLIATRWCDPTISSCSGPSSANRAVHVDYDALGRMIRSEDRTNGSAVPETVRQFSYDYGVNTATPSINARNVLGRLAQASSPTSSVAYSYDGFGRAEAVTYRDLTAPSDNVFVQKHQFNGDGSIQSFGLLLPDNGHVEEKVAYTYDSARRVRSADYSDGVSTQNLFSATGPLRIDSLGRIRDATFGQNAYSATFAENGRRMLKSMKVSSLQTPESAREYTFPGVAFDPLGRERTRTEVVDGNLSTPLIESSYDALGRLQSATRKLGSQRVSDLQFVYDDLGNIQKQQNNLDGAGALGTVSLSYEGSDSDRVCGIAFGGGSPVPACSVKYDGVGAIVEMPTRMGGTRVLSYFPNGQTRSITMGGTAATFDYDAFGAVQRLVLESTSSTDTRRDKHFGDFIYQRDEVVDGIRKSVLNRSFQGPLGLRATRHGPTADAPWTFVFGEQRGTRFVTDQAGAFVQDIDYQPFGEVKSATGAQPGSPLYVNSQWNGGDLLAALGVSQLGARLYDPAIGRFLSRDPLIVPRTSSGTNPYAFAMNDPVNRADPSGMDVDLGISKPSGCVGLECNGPPIFGPFLPPGGGGGGGGGGNPTHPDCGNGYYCVPAGPPQPSAPYGPNQPGSSPSRPTTGQSPLVYNQPPSPGLSHPEHQPDRTAPLGGSKLAPPAPNLVWVPDMEVWDDIGTFSDHTLFWENRVKDAYGPFMSNSRGLKYLGYGVKTVKVLDLAADGLALGAAGMDLLEDPSDPARGMRLFGSILDVSFGALGPFGEPLKLYKARVAENAMDWREDSYYHTPKMKEWIQRNHDKR